MNHNQNSKKDLKDKGETPAVIVNGVQINETTTLPLPTEEEWRQATSEDHDLGYIKMILSCTEETPIETKEPRKKGYVEPFQQGHMELDNGLIYYYDTRAQPILYN